MIDTNTPLYEHVKTLMTTYYQNMFKNNQHPENIYSLVITEAEQPLIEATMKLTANNQSESAKMLGLNRGTFRKKLKLYGML